MFHVKRNTQKTGQTGEDLAAKFLINRGFKIVERNYRKKWGEIDIIAEKAGILHFVEVKALRVRPSFAKDTEGNVEYKPEDNIRSWKKLRMGRAIRTYFPDRKISDEQEFEIDVVAIYLDFDHKKAKIRFLENIILT
jgi:putative endonuclease